ncbi:MAG: hypothetical protein NT080_00305 [Spirochaetes bacterium]|nr:hypothetical protein [Spirochaetota bacterium]
MKALKKGTVFLVGIGVLCGMYAGAALVGEAAFAAIAPTIVVAVPMLVVAFSGANVADNWQRALHYRPELDTAKP